MKLHIKTFGCRANQYDSESVRALAVANGVEIVEDAELADVAVVNSCAVTSDAEADLRQHVRRLSRLKPGIRTVVMGCAAERSTAAISQLPGVSDVVAGADMPRVAGALGLKTGTSLQTTSQSGARALLRIQDGCGEHCTFCATTLARGAPRSRSIAELVREATALAAQHSEIVLTGIHIGHYGADIDSTLSVLLRHLLRDVAGVRFRLSSIEATEIDSELSDLLSERDRLVPHVHAPLQSASDRLLKLMGRHWYSAASYRDALLRLASRVPFMGIGADIITGFPTESSSDHEETLRLVEEVPFTYLHVFPYSARPGTAALRLGAPVEASLRRARASELRAVGEAKRKAYQATRVGGRADVLVISNGAQPQGVTEDYLTVHLPSPVVPRGEIFSAELRGSATRLEAVPR